MARNMEDDIFTPEEAAGLLGVKLMTLYQWVHRKKIKCFRLGAGRIMRFRRGVVEALIAKREDEKKAAAEAMRRPAKKKIDLDAVARETLGQDSHGRKRG